MMALRRFLYGERDARAPRRCSRAVLLLGFEGDGVGGGVGGAVVVGYG